MGWGCGRRRADARRTQGDCQRGSRRVLAGRALRGGAVPARLSPQPYVCMYSIVYKQTSDSLCSPRGRPRLCSVGGGRAAARRPTVRRAPLTPPDVTVARSGSGRRAPQSKKQWRVFGSRRSWHGASRHYSEKWHPDGCAPPRLGSRRRLLQVPTQRSNLGWARATSPTGKERHEWESSSATHAGGARCILARNGLDRVDDAVRVKEELDLQRRGASG